MHDPERSGITFHLEDTVFFVRPSFATILLLCRLYIPDDTDYIEQDMDQLKGLFLADGQGLPADDVDALCAPIVDLLNVLQLETGILIKNFKDVSSCRPAMSCWSLSLCTIACYCV